MSKRAFRRIALVAACAGAPFLIAGPAGAAQSNSAGANLSEIVVTAARREQSLSKVTLSVSAFTQQKMDIEGIKSFAQISNFTPGVVFDYLTHNVTIRGLSSIAGSGTTGVYLDDTPVQMRNLGFNANNTEPVVFDLDRVEVLRGPQGTLFGAGSEGGTVRYITNQPSLSHYSGFAHAEVAGTLHGSPSYEAGVAEGGPLINDKLGFRVSVWGRRDGGWIDRVDYQTLDKTQENANWVETFAARAALTWKPIPSLEITPAIDFQRRNQHNYDNYWVGISNPGSGSFLSGTPDRQPDHDKFLLPTLKIEWYGPGVNFISNTSYYARKETVGGYSGTLYNLSYFEDFLNGSIWGYPADPQGNPCGACAALNPLLTPTGLNLPGLPNYLSHNKITNSQYDWTQEFRLQSSNPTSRLQWTAGVFMAFNFQRSVEEIYDPELEQVSQILWGEDVLTAWGENLLPNGDDYIKNTASHDRQIALYADASFNITQRLKAEAGLRVAFTHYDFVSLDDGPQDLLDNGGVPNITSGGKSETPLTPKFSLSYQATDDDMVYATIAKGFRPGGATPPLPVVACGGEFPTQYDSDTVWSYELGTKDRFFNRTLSVAASGYYLKWNNIQTNVIVPTCAIAFTTNAGEAESKGFDLQAQWSPSRAFEFDLAVGYTDLVYTTTTNSVAGVLAAKGDTVNVPPWTVTLGGQYNFSVANLPAFVRADYEFKSKRTKPLNSEDPNTGFYDPGLVPDPSTNVVNLRIGVTVNKVDLAIYANNLLNAHPQLNLNHEDVYTLLYEATTFRPLTIGVSANMKF